MTAPALLVALCGMALAGSAAADNLVLRPRLTFSQAYDDNVRSLAEDTQDDLVTTFAPGLVTRYRTDRGSSTLSFDLRAHQYLDNTDLDGLDRAASFDVDYMVTPRFTLASSGRYDYYENTDTYELEDDLIAGNPDAETISWTGRGRYALGSRTAVSLTPSFFRSEYSDQELPYCYFGNRRAPSAVPPCTFIAGPIVDGVFTRIPTYQPVLNGSLSEVWGADLGLERNVTELDTATLRIGESWRDFERGSSAGDQTSDNSNTVDSVEVGWRREWTPRLSTRVELGVERIRSDTNPFDVTALGYRTFTAQSTLPAFDDTSTIAIGSFEVNYRVRGSLLSLRYSRESNPSVSYGTSLDTQIVSGSFERRINSRLAFDLSGYWSHQESLGDTITDLNVVATPDPTDPRVLRASCGPSSIEVVEVDTVDLFQTDCLGFSSQQANQDSIGIGAALNWQMTRQFSTFLRYRWYQRTAGGDTRLSDYDKNVFTLGFTYSYDVNLY